MWSRVEQGPGMHIVTAAVTNGATSERRTSIPQMSVLNGAQCSLHKEQYDDNKHLQVTDFELTAEFLSNVSF